MIFNVLFIIFFYFITFLFHTLLKMSYYSLTEPTFSGSIIENIGFVELSPCG